MSKTRILCHIVFGTKSRKFTLLAEKQWEIYKYINGIISHLGCHLIQINGIEDHIHILADISPIISLSELLKRIKQSSSYWIKENNILSGFDGWSKGYFAVSISPRDIDSCKRYIANQKEHHKGVVYTDEIKSFISKLGMEWFDEEWQ
ncbi:MAG: IS200/IS605 family transposase [Muribaculaceae bacterium]|nr:IS200/IS605 family transposase [Muribaculaceae bacterium]